MQFPLANANFTALNQITFDRNLHRTSTQLNSALNKVSTLDLCPKLRWQIIDFNFFSEDAISLVVILHELLFNLENLLHGAVLTHDSRLELLKREQHSFSRQLGRFLNAKSKLNSFNRGPVTRLHRLLLSIGIPL